MTISRKALLGVWGMFLIGIVVVGYGGFVQTSDDATVAAFVRHIISDSFAAMMAIVAALTLVAFLSEWFGFHRLAIYTMFVALLPILPIALILMIGGFYVVLFTSFFPVIAFLSADFDIVRSLREGYIHNTLILAAIYATVYCFGVTLVATICAWRRSRSGLATAV